MDNVELKLVAVVVAALEEVEPSGVAPLPDLGAGPRVLIERAAGGSLVAEAITDEAVAASLDAEHAALGALPARALPFSLPRRLGADHSTAAALGLEGDDAPVRVLISEPLPGHRVDTAVAAGDLGLVRSLARALAAVHDSPIDAVLAAGLPAFDSVELHDRLVADVDRAAESGKVPPALLSRWEHEFETAGLWRFTPTVVHGRFTEADALVDDSAVVAVTGWDGLKVADPAEDLAWALSALAPDTVDAFFDEYRGHRRTADDGLRRRAELYSELSLLEWLLYGLDSGDAEVTADAGALLGELSDMLAPEAALDGSGPDGDPGTSEEAEPWDHEEATTGEIPVVSGGGSVAPDNSSPADESTWTEESASPDESARAADTGLFEESSPPGDGSSRRDAGDPARED